MIYAFIITLKKISFYVLIIIIYCVTFGLIGNEIFAYTARFNGTEHKVAVDRVEAESPEVNFDNFWNSITAVFLTILNEEWHIVMYDYIRNVGLGAVGFYAFIIVTGEVIVMKLFLALFINNYLELVKKRGALEPKEETIESESNSDNE